MAVSRLSQWLLLNNKANQEFKVRTSLACSTFLSMSNKFNIIRLIFFYLFEVINCAQHFQEVVTILSTLCPWRLSRGENKRKIVFTLQGFSRLFNGHCLYKLSASFFFFFDDDAAAAHPLGMDGLVLGNTHQTVERTVLETLFVVAACMVWTERLKIVLNMYME